MARTALRRTSATWSAALYRCSAHPGGPSLTRPLWESCRPSRRLCRLPTRPAATTGGKERQRGKEECQKLGYGRKEPPLDSSSTLQRRIILSSVAQLLVALGSSTSLLEVKGLTVNDRERERGGRGLGAPLTCHVMMIRF